jgi:hypothetical protein
MDHKAYVFDYNAFMCELSGALLDALSTGQTDSLVKFVEENRDSLTDPDEGEPLDESWRDMLETAAAQTYGGFALDAHAYGDFALTKFYDPADNIGLSHYWDEVETLLDCELGHADYVVLGSPFGPPDELFDPGKMGSYFQSPAEVKEHLSQLEHLAGKKTEIAPCLGKVIEMLRLAAAQGKGLYVRF